MEDVRGDLDRGPAGANLSGGALPRLDRDPRVKTLEDRLLRGQVTPARDALAESAQDGQRVRVGSAVGGPDDGDIVDVLGVEGV